MKKKSRPPHVDGPTCPAKMEAATKNPLGATTPTASFLTQKLTLDADDARFDAILDEVVRVCKKVEPDCVIQR